MSSLTNYAENLVINWLLTNGTPTRPTAWYIALHTADPTEDGSVGEVVVGTDADYVRQAITFGAPTVGQGLNSGSVSWTAASDATTHVVTHGSIWDAATAGNCLLKGPLLASRSRVASSVLTFPIGDIVAAAD
jgi:hypothetical protein